MRNSGCATPVDSTVQADADKGNSVIGLAALIADFLRSRSVAASRQSPPRSKHAPSDAKHGAVMWNLAKILGLPASCPMPLSASAQDYRSKPIRLVVPFPPGGPSDIIGRVLGQKMQELLGQLVIIDNRAGAGGVLGTDNVAKSEPDGYSIAIASAGALAISSALQEKVLYDSLKDLAAITLVAKVPELLVASTTVPVSNVKELVALAKAKPGAINYGSTGPGSMPHLAGELFRTSAQIDIVHVPYRGAASAVNDLVGHQVQIMFLDVPILLPQIQAGAIKALAVGSKLRVPSLPDLPTMNALGYPQIEADNWYGMVAPARTPRPIIAKLNAAAVAAMKAPEVQEKLASQGAILIGDTPEQFAAYMASEIVKWAKVVQAAGIKVNKNHGGQTGRQGGDRRRRGLHRTWLGQWTCDGGYLRARGRQGFCGRPRCGIDARDGRAGARSGRREYDPPVRCDRRQCGCRHDRCLPGGPWSDRHSGQQCRRLGRGRSCGVVRRCLGWPARLQSHHRIPRLQACPSRHGPAKGRGRCQHILGFGNSLQRLAAGRLRRREGRRY